jgi:hypothetical protein
MTETAESHNASYKGLMRYTAAACLLVGAVALLFSCPGVRKHLPSLSISLNATISPAKSFCLGPPYLYVTVHDEPGNVLKYSRNGCLLDDSVLNIFGEAESPFDVELRSMSLGNFRGIEDVLYVVDASQHNSRIMIFDQCNEDGSRDYITTVADYEENMGLDHSYGICFDDEDNMYISSQHTDNVLHFYKNTFRPMPLPPLLAGIDYRMHYFPGTFVQFGQPKEHDKTQQGVRAIAYVEGRIWIAHEVISGIAIADLTTGSINEIVPFDNPIGLYYHEDRNTVFVSCKSKEIGGIVYAMDVNTFEILQTYENKRMIHPTGMCIL